MNYLADALHRALDALSLHVLKHLPLYHELDLRQLHQFFLETRLGAAGSWLLRLCIYMYIYIYSASLSACVWCVGGKPLLNCLLKRLCFMCA